MNDVLIKNEHQNNKNNNENNNENNNKNNNKNNNFENNNNQNNNFENNICLDISSCEFCGDLSCYNKVVSNVNGGSCYKRDNTRNSIENDSKIYKKSSLRKYLVGGVSEESEVLYNNDNDCLICYDMKDCKPIVVCSLCSKFCHYKCYKKFTKKNNFYAMKCIQCGTRSLQFKKSWWQFWCCF